MSRQRTYLGNANSPAERVRVFRTGEGIEIDLFDYSEIERRRVFFAEVELVTLHARGGGPRAWMVAVLAVLFAVLAVLSKSEPVLLYTWAGIGFVLGLLAGVLFVVPAWTITIFGRRTLARVVFRWREGKARRIYGELCREVAQVQELRALLAREAEPPSPLPMAFVPPAFVPLPAAADPGSEA